MEKDENKQVRRWFTEEELQELENLRDKKEIVKTNRVYPDLHTQVMRSVQTIAKEKDDIICKIEQTGKLGGLDEVADLLVKSIYDDFVASFDPFNRDNEPDFARKAFAIFANDTYAKVEAVQLLRELDQSLRVIENQQKRIELAKQGVLI